MTIYIPNYEEDVVEPIQYPDGRYTNEDLYDLHEEFYYEYYEAKDALDEHVKVS